MTKMVIRDVTEDTRVTIDNFRFGGGLKIGNVHALKECGCDGPWLGTMEVVPKEEWTYAQRNEHEKRGLGMTKLWKIYPVQASNQYTLALRSVGAEFGQMAAALKLRDFIADRNRKSGQAPRMKTR